MSIHDYVTVPEAVKMFVVESKNLRRALIKGMDFKLDTDCRKTGKSGAWLVSVKALEKHYERREGV